MSALGKQIGPAYDELRQRLIVDSAVNLAVGAFREQGGIGFALALQLSR
jgi:hypothetical protein